MGSHLKTKDAKLVVNNREIMESVYMACGILFILCLGSPSAQEAARKSNTFEEDFDVLVESQGLYNRLASVH